MSIRPYLLSMMLILLCSRSAAAEVGDVTLQTDHPLYPGEGAFQTPEDCVAWATQGCVTDQQRAIAIFNWLLTHQWHLMSPQEWCQPGRQPGLDRNDYEMVVYDANRGRFSYGYGLCGTVHAWNEAYWRAAGFPARRRAFPGHSNSEVLLNGRWRMFDTDMAGIFFNDDGSVAGYDDITRDLTLLDRQLGDAPRYPFAWPSDFEAMKAGWKQVAEGRHWYALYYGGYAAHPGIVHLRSGEAFTRYAHPDGFGGPSNRRFWHQQQDGPGRDWTFANNGHPFHRGKESNARGLARYGNAVFDYSPPLVDGRWREGVVASSRNLIADRNGLQSSNGTPASVTFSHFSPYVICGDPQDDADPMLGSATNGLRISGHCTGTGTLAVSPDQGQTWSTEYAVDGDFELDLTDLVKGRYGWQIRLTLAAGTSFQRLQFTTTCQLCETIYPRLTPNGSLVSYRTKQRAVQPVLPLLADAEATEAYCEVVDMRSENLAFVGRSESERLAYRVRGPKPASVVFRIDSPTDLRGLSAAARFGLRSPTPPGSRFHLDYSLDSGNNWQPLAALQPPADNEFSSGWIYGTSEFKGEKEALVRVRMYAGGFPTGLITAELYGLRETQPPSATTITWSWFEGDQRRDYSYEVPAGTTDHTTSVPTGDTVRDDFVRISVD